MVEVAALSVGVKMDGVDDLIRKLKDVNAASDKLSPSTEKAGRSARDAAKGLKTMDQASQSLARGLGTLIGRLGAMAAAALSIRQTVSTLSNFERSMSGVAAVTRATEGEIAQLRDVAKDLGATTEFSASQAAEGLRFLGMAGFSTAESIAAIPAVLDLATASQMGLAEAADISSNMMSAFGIAATDAASVADILAAASSRANTNVSQMGEGMKFVGPVASALGIRIGDTAAAIGTLSDAGIQGGMAGTGLRRVLSSLTNPTNQAAEALGSLGLTIDQVNPATTSLTDIIDTLSIAGLDAATALTIFGDRGGPAILALVENNDKLRTLTGELRNVDGEASRMAGTMRDNLGGSLDGLWSAIEGLIIALGEAGLTAALRGVIDGATALVRGISKLIDAVGKVTGTLRGFGEVLLVITATQIPALVTGLGRAAAGLTLIEIQFIAGAVAARAMAVATGLLSRALALVGGPIGILIGGLALVATNALRARANLRELKETTDDLRMASQGYADIMREFYRTLTEESYNAAVAATDNFIMALEASIAAARASLSDASFWTNFFGISLYETEQMASLRASIDSMEAGLASARDRQTELRDRAGEFAETTVTTNDSLSRANSILGDFILQQGRANELQSAALVYGQDSIEYLRIRQRQEEAILHLKLEQAVAEADNVELAREMADEVLRIYQRNQDLEMLIARLTQQFGLTAEAARGVAVAVSAITNALNHALGPASRLRAMLGAIGSAAQGTWLGEIGGGIFGNVAGMVSGAGSQLLNALGSAWDAAQTHAGTIRDTVSGGGGGGGSALRPLIEDAETLTEQMTPLQQATEGWRSTLQDGIVDAIVEGKNLIGVFADLAKAIAKAALEAALFNTGPFGVEGGMGLLSFLFNAKGNVFSQGNVIPFAQGGVVSRPTAFPMASGVGIMGEAGPEAIMPLARGPGGDLGVKGSIEIVLHAPPGFTAEQMKAVEGVAVKVVTSSNRQQADKRYLAGAS